MDEDLQRCVEMLKENDADVRKQAENTLLTLCRDILKNPEKEEYREVRLDDPTVVDRLLPAIGAMECLFSVGFTEATDSFHLPRSKPLEKLKALEKLLAKSRSKVSENISGELEIVPVEMPSEKSLIDTIKSKFSSVLRYEDRELQMKARNVIPIMELEIATISKVRQLQKQIKLSQENSKTDTEQQCSDHDVNCKDLFLIELTHWFKHKFFKWIDSPKCPICLGDSKYESVMNTKDLNCPQIELHRCQRCKTLVKFPRYCDPEPLLTLRCGRCGEWANVFTLLCRALDYDARLVHDETDHCWTEVWSAGQKRWLHVEPCEGVLDKPLMYERGWGKKLSYIIACSKDEVQDVTWRYTRDLKNVLKRRRYCSEKTLLNFIDLLNAQRQTAPGYSTHRRNYVIKRRLLELVELLHMPNDHKLDDGQTYGGRTTGSYAWRLARGEVKPKSISESYTWDISKYEETFQLQYFIVNDTYKIIGQNGTVLDEKSGWQSGVSTTEGGIFRKVETDWKMAYLARSLNNTRGIVKWVFENSKANVRVASFNLRATVQEFHGASVTWTVEGIYTNNGKQCESRTLLIKDCSNYETNDLRGATKIVLTATLTGGEGHTAWQHAQLFRQSLDSTDKSLAITIRLEV